MSNGYKGHGWIIFSGILLVLAGLGMIVMALGVLSANDSVQEQFQGTLVFSDGNIDVWGWIYLIIGSLVTIAGFGVFARAQWAVWTGILAAGAQFIAAMFFSFNPNFWGPALAILVVDAMVIHGLSRYGLEAAEV